MLKGILLGFLLPVRVSGGIVERSVIVRKCERLVYANRSHMRTMFAYVNAMHHSSGCMVFMYGPWLCVVESFCLGAHLDSLSRLSVEVVVVLNPPSMPSQQWSLAVPPSHDRREVSRQREALG